ncbi:hypothetical protein [Lactobacillus sp. PSON]|uniref:hypothetical protein n=1 Tax=Lactobacillus sp. PSON TaxID=3455454 RepID=UPI004042CD33
MKIYIVCPYNKTGGPRSLHQLGNNLVSKGLDVYMYYGNHGQKIKASKLLYNDSKAKIADNIEDQKDNVVITSEYDTGWLLKIKKAKKVIWWLSLTYYLNNDILADVKKYTSNKNESSFYIPIRYFKRIIKDKLNGKSDKFVKKSKDFQTIYHLYNCEYVREYITSRGVKDIQMQYLCGPIDLVNNDLSIDNILKDKENIIVYNPAKMDKDVVESISEYLQKYYPSYIFKPLQNMTHNEVLNNLRKAKVYLDLGYFPGPERMPREAVMQYCNIITANRGSAANSIDIPIPKKYKFGIDELNVKKLCELAVNMCDNFAVYTPEYDKYREKVINQINRFDSDINNFCDYIKRN